LTLAKGMYGTSDFLQFFYNGKQEKSLLGVKRGNHT